MLASPGGQTQTIATNVGNLTNATFSSNLFAGDPVDGTWTLKIFDSNNVGTVGQLVNWSLHVNAGKLVSSTASTGNEMDQNPGLDTVAHAGQDEGRQLLRQPDPHESGRRHAVRGPLRRDDPADHHRRPGARHGRRRHCAAASTITVSGCRRATRCRA